MRRLNPKTNQPFKRGELREDGKVFWQYVKKTIKNDGFFAETWITTETFNTHLANQKIAKKEHQKTKYGHLVKMIGAIRHRAKKKNIPFDIDVEYLELIATDGCPIFHTVFDWGLDKKGGGKNRPSLDRIIPELGYIKGNVAFISKWANIIKSDATEKELYAIADWLHEARKNAKKKSNAPLPARDGRKSKNHT
jgi:hypothetical protein